MQQKNPQGFQTINALMQNNGNPQALLQQLMGNATSEQKESLIKQAKQFGAPTEILSMVQNMK